MIYFCPLWFSPSPPQKQSLLINLLCILLFHLKNKREREKLVTINSDIPRSPTACSVGNVLFRLFDSITMSIRSASVFRKGCFPEYVLDPETN